MVRPLPQRSAEERMRPMKPRIIVHKEGGGWVVELRRSARRYEVYGADSRLSWEDAVSVAKEIAAKEAALYGMVELMIRSAVSYEEDLDARINAPRVRQEHTSMEPPEPPQDAPESGR